MKIDISTQQTFIETFQVINKKRKTLLIETANTHVKKDLLENGITAVRGLFTKEDLSDMINFQYEIEKSLGNNFSCGGYINFIQNNNQISVNISKVEPNHGQVRVQTKGMQFEMPGFKKISTNSFLKEIFSWWHQDDGNITRGTMEWIIPAEINHNGWHKDTVRPQLKAFILLGDVDFNTAPMYYAKKSHIINNNFEQEVAYRLFKDGTSKISNYLRRSGKHYPAIVGCNSGYLSDNESKNDPDEISLDPITLGGFMYDKFVCTGSLGDVIFFDSCGFHSGNKSHGKIRRTISLSSPSNSSDIALAFDLQDKRSV